MFSGSGAPKRGAIISTFASLSMTLFIRKHAQPAFQDLKTFPNPAPGRDFHIHMEIPEFTCLCPKTGQPDFATLILDYIPERPASN